VTHADINAEATQGCDSPEARAITRTLFVLAVALLCAAFVFA
jgi:hypothetical protein